jgi:hypothetical protein
MSVVITAREALDGKINKERTTPAFVQPLQFIPRAEKTQEWCYDNADWLELIGLRQITKKAPHFAKNYNLAAGIIDKNDYFGNTSPDNKQLLDNLMMNDEPGHLDIKFYPFIPTFVNVLCTEFSKRNNKYSYISVDPYSYNEMLEFKKDQITETLLSQAQQKIINQMIESGVDPQDPEIQQQLQQQMSPENLKTLPEIEEYFNKSYRSMVEEWATHQHRDDVLRFRMNEMEERNFRNSLVTDSCYFHFKMLEDDYKIEEWNPMFTAIFKSPETRYASEGHSAINVKFMTIPEILDEHGSDMTEEQQRSLEHVYTATSVGYDIKGYQRESQYDNTKSVEWNTTGPSLAMRQLTSHVEGVDLTMLDRLLGRNTTAVAGEPYYARVSTCYWKSQRKVGHLTKIADTGEVVVDIVDEDYEVTDKPIYNTTLIDEKNERTLIFGEHIEWLYINQVYGGVKIGPNTPSYWGMPIADSTNGFQPIYIGINQNKVGPIKYQFKGDRNLYGCKLPVEGATFSDYNTRSTCAVDILKPYQISYNVVNNQIADILVDELGSIVALDPNQLPTTSLGEDWGPQNYAKAYVAMRNFSILPLDKRLQNTQSSQSSAAPTQVLNLAQTDRLKSRIDLAVYFKNEGLSQVGITPNRLGQPTGRQTASGQEENVNASYTQTEKYFTQFSHHLMPRVHQMRTDLAQYYNSTKPSVRLSHLTSKEERVNFQINGTDLLLRELNIHTDSDPANVNVMEELKKLLITNNTAGGTIYELGSLLTAESLGEMNNILKGIEKRSLQQKQAEMSEAQNLQKMKEESDMRERMLEMDFEAKENEKERRKDILVAEIRASGYSGSVDLDQNQQNDFMDNLDRIQRSSEYQQSMGMETLKEANKVSIAKQKLDIDREKLMTQRELKRMDLDIARENQTASEIEAKRKNDKKKAEAKNKKK